MAKHVDYSMYIVQLYTRGIPNSGETRHGSSHGRPSTTTKQLVGVLRKRQLKTRQLCTPHTTRWTGSLPGSWSQHTAHPPSQQGDTTGPAAAAHMVTGQVRERGAGWTLTGGPVPYLTLGPRGREVIRLITNERQPQWARFLVF